MLQVEDLHAGYGASEVLTGTTLTVKQGTLVALIGANGAGKTTTMRAISGGLKPSRGKVLLDGQEVQGLDASRIARLGLAHSPDGRKVFGPLLRLPRPGQGRPGPSLRLVPPPAGPHPPVRRHPLRRRAADAGHRPRPHGPAQGHAAG